MLGKRCCSLGTILGLKIPVCFILEHLVLLNGISGFRSVLVMTLLAIYAGSYTLESVGLLFSTSNIFWYCGSPLYHYSLIAIVKSVYMIKGSISEPYG